MLLCSVGSLPLSFFFIFYYFSFLGSLPWSFISVISRAGGEVANRPDGSRKRTRGKPGLQFSFPSFTRSSIFVLAPRQFIITA